MEDDDCGSVNGEGKGGWGRVKGGGVRVKVGGWGGEGSWGFV